MTRFWLQLTINLHRNEIAIQFPRDSRRLKTRARHRITPITAGLADLNEQRFVLRLGRRQHLRDIGVPVDRIVGVFEQVGKIAQNQAIVKQRLAIDTEPTGVPIGRFLLLFMAFLLGLRRE
nr:hypothetical protein [Halothiobacillus sp.]